MRKIIADIAVSLDGYIAGRRGELDWLVFDEEQNFVNEFLSRFDVIFYGRVAYQQYGVHLQNVRKYVFSRSHKHVAGNAMVINRNIRKQVEQIKSEEGKDIWLCGGASIIQTFAELDMIDEYMLAIQPVFLGSGKPLFNNFPHRIRLSLINGVTLNSGVVILNYRPLVQQIPLPKLIVESEH